MSKTTTTKTTEPTPAQVLSTARAALSDARQAHRDAQEDRDDLIRTAAPTTTPDDVSRAQAEVTLAESRVKAAERTVRAAEVGMSREMAQRYARVVADKLAVIGRPIAIAPDTLPEGETFGFIVQPGSGKLDLASGCLEGSAKVAVQKHELLDFTASRLADVLREDYQAAPQVSDTGYVSGKVRETMPVVYDLYSEYLPRVADSIASWVGEVGGEDHYGHRCVTVRAGQVTVHGDNTDEDGVRTVTLTLRLTAGAEVVGVIPAETLSQGTDQLAGRFVQAGRVKAARITSTGRQVVQKWRQGGVDREITQPYADLEVTIVSRRG